MNDKTRLNPASSTDSSSEDEERDDSTVRRAQQDERTRMQPSAPADADEEATRLAPQPELPDERTRRFETAVPTKPDESPPDEDATVVRSDTDAETQVAAGVRSTDAAAFTTPQSPTDDATRVHSPGSSFTSPTGAHAHGDSGEELKVGSVLRNRFRIEKVLGEGGMGKVFSAVDLLKQEARDDQIHVALKVMKQDLVDAELSFMGLQREARRAQQLAHPNIVTVYDFDRADGHIYMTMEHLSGQPVNALLKQHRHGLPTEQARDITKQIARGLAYAHREGIVHVDLKPQNVFVLENGRTKILDFGIAKAYQSKKADRVEDVFSGYSPPYASPQLIAGERPTPQDDVYALAILAYALFTGRHPFDWKPADQARAEGMRPRRDRSMRRSEWRAIRKGLSFHADHRQRDAMAFLKRFSPSRIKQAAKLLSVASVTAALAFFLLYRPEAGPEVPFEQLDSALQERIVTELRDAGTFSELGDFDSALQLYHGVLLLHPGNLEATAGMNETVEQALNRMRALQQRGDLSAGAVRASLDALGDYDAMPNRARELIDDTRANL